jgi:hypothetical protein
LHGFLVRLFLFLPFSSSWFLLLGRRFVVFAVLLVVFTVVFAILLPVGAPFFLLLMLQTGDFPQLAAREDVVAVAGGVCKRAKRRVASRAGLLIPG